MNEQQIPKLTGSLVEHQNSFASLPTDDAQWVVQNTVEAIGFFVEAIKNRGQRVVTQVVQTATAITKRVLTPWKTLQIGGEPIAQVLTAIVDAGDEVSPNARFICEQSTFTVAREQKSVDFVKLTPADFGFTNVPRTDEFLTKEFLAKWSADHLDGYVVELCEAEDGPQLRRQCQDQPKLEVLWMAMERLAGSGGYPRVFRVGRHGDGRRWLDARWVYPYGQWNLDGVVVFRFRKITQPSAA